MIPEWLNEGTKTKANKQEKKLAKDIGARLTPNSGATSFAKGDMYTDEYLVESKATGNASFILKKEVLEKIEREAIQEGKIPLLIIELQERRYYVYREQDINV